jgi:hypothetical protein
LVIILIKLWQYADRLIWPWEHIPDTYLPEEIIDAESTNLGQPDLPYRVNSAYSSRRKFYEFQRPLDLNEANDWLEISAGLYAGQREILANWEIEHNWFESEYELRSLSFIDSSWFDDHCHQFYCLLPPERPFYLNLADSATWTRIPGLGPVLADRIIAYRSNLGGFHSPSQLIEVYGISDSALASWSYVWRLDSKEIRPLSYPTDSFRLLLGHPYLEYVQVEELFRFHDNMGYWLPCNDWILLNSFDSVLIDRLTPYFPDE